MGIRCFQTNTLMKKSFIDKENFIQIDLTIFNHRVQGKGLFIIQSWNS